MKQRVGSYIKAQYDLDEKMKCVKYSNSSNAALKIMCEKDIFFGFNCNKIETLRWHVDNCSAGVRKISTSIAFNTRLIWYEIVHVSI